MSKTKNKPGIHLHVTIGVKKNPRINVYKKEYYWNIIASNGREIARSSETYSRKSNAVKSIKVVAAIFYWQLKPTGNPYYYDHSKKDSPLQSYL